MEENKKTNELDEVVLENLEATENVNEVKVEEMEEATVNGCDLEVVEEVHAEEVSKKVSFLDSLVAIVIDEAVLALASFCGFYIFNAILKLLGMQFPTQYALTWMVIIYAVFSVLYFAIMEGSCKASTLGKMVAKSRVTK